MMILRVFLAILVPCSSFGQIMEDFSDGNITSGPHWMGHTQSFMVNPDQQLQLDGTGSGQAYLATLSNVTNAAVWQFDVEMDFNPSARNFCKIYLISDHHDLSSELNGYYLKIGGSQDEVSLYRQDLSDHFEIIDGADGTTDKAVVKLSIKVTRDHDGRWEVFLDSLLNNQYQLMGEVVDNTHHRANYFGLFCQFTTTRSRHFFFDNIKVMGAVFTDQQPPMVESLGLIDNQRIAVLFNEPVLIDPSQIMVTGIGNPVLVREIGYSSWQFEFPFSFENGIPYTLELIEVSDLFGNPITGTYAFTFWETEPADKHDIIITEIMADPTPAIQFAEMEYLEIHNRSDKAINLKNWILSDQTTRVLLPEHLIAPGEYLLLHPESESLFHSKNSLSLKPWPTLNNSGDLISLADSTGSMIHFVNYDVSWYRSDLKKHGGWSLEMIDVGYPCSGINNWTASASSSGGTPGFANSVATDNPDLTPPVMISTFAQDPNQLKIFFDQPLSPLIGSTAEIHFEPPLRVDTFFVESNFDPSITVYLIDPLEMGSVYQVNAVGIADCNHNVDYDLGSFALTGLAQEADSGDLIINEILFNPPPLGVRFVEIYNRADKPVNLQNWRFASWQGQTLSGFSPLTTDNHVIYPGDYRVFTTDIRKLQSQYPLGRVETMLEVDELAAMSDKQGSLALVTSDGLLMDSLFYHQDMHHPLLIDQNGVALERANPEAPTNDVNNWYSGSEQTGYASPGYQNSQFVVSTAQDRFRVEPKFISPLSSRFPSYARVSFTLDQPGNSGTLLVFNKQGQLIRTLVSNAILSTEGTFQWDGTDDQARRVPMGYYIMYFKVTGKNFATESWMQTIAVVPDFP